MIVQKLRTKDWLIGVGVMLLLIYVTVYTVVSRQGYAEAARVNSEGFYYFSPEDSGRWRTLNGTCLLVFWPINMLDAYLGWGRCPATEPLFDLS